MGAIYAEMMHMKKISLEEVPSIWREEASRIYSIKYEAEEQRV